MVLYTTTDQQPPPPSPLDGDGRDGLPRRVHGRWGRSGSSIEALIDLNPMW